MNAHHRMKLRRILQLEVLQLLALLQALPEQRTERLHVVDGIEPGDELLHPVAQAVVGRRHADEHGVAADRGQLSLAHRMVAIGGSARNVSSECQTSVPNGGVVSSLRNLISSGAFLPSFGANGCTVSSPNRRPKSINCSEVMSWSRKMISSFSTSAVSIAANCASEQRLAQIDAGDLGAEIDADAPHGDAGALRYDRPCHARIDALVHGRSSDDPPDFCGLSAHTQVAAQRPAPLP